MSFSGLLRKPPLKIQKSKRGVRNSSLRSKLLTEGSRSVSLQ